jgi:hypothetical protein
MNEAWAMVIVSVVTGTFGVLIAYVNKFRKENREDHMTVMDMLRHVNRNVVKVEDKIDLLDDRLDTHIHVEHKPKPKRS